MSGSSATKCKKWRALPKNTNADDLPEQWHRSMNVHDRLRNSCSAADSAQTRNKEHTQYDSGLRLSLGALKNTKTRRHWWLRKSFYCEVGQHEIRRWADVEVSIADFEDSGGEEDKSQTSEVKYAIRKKKPLRSSGPNVYKINHDRPRGSPERQ